MLAQVGMGKDTRRRTRSLRPRVDSRINFVVAVCLFAGATLFAACATQSVVQVQHPFPSTQHRTIWIEQCIDRSEYKGERNLAEEATQTLKDKVLATKLFELDPGAMLRLTCDLEGFVEGSAFQRWLLPGWGATEARIAVMVWETPGDNVLATFRSHASVKTGGLYTIGADQYIIGVGMNDIVGQLETWAKGGTSSARPD
jgi:hypothetical protein